MLMELMLFLRFYFGRDPQEDLQEACRYLNDSHYEFGKMFVTHHIVTCLYKNVTEQMTSNSVSAQIFLAL